MMKKLSLSLIAVLSLNAVTPAFADSGLSARQEQLMKLVEEQGAKKALQSLTNEELLQAKEDIRGIVQALQSDFTMAIATEGDRVGYKIRRYGAYGVGAGIVLVAAGFMAEGLSKPGPDGGGFFMAGLLLGGVVGAASSAVTTTGQLIVWLTPSEVNKVQVKIKSMAELVQLLDKKLGK